MSQEIQKREEKKHGLVWFWAGVQREKKCMAYDLHPVLIPYLVSQNSSKLKNFNQGFLSNCDFRVFPLYAHSRFQGFNL